MSSLTTPGFNTRSDFPPKTQSTMFYQSCQQLIARSALAAWKSGTALHMPRNGLGTRQYSMGINGYALVTGAGNDAFPLV